MDANGDLLSTSEPAIEQPAFDTYTRLIRGKRRTIYRPRSYTRFLHTKMLYLVRTQLPSMTWSTASRPGDSMLRHLERHSYNRYWYKLDLQSAYDQVDRQRLARLVWELLPYEERSVVKKFRIELELERFFFQRGGKGLATGGNASPELFNLYCHKLIDRQVADICVKQRLTYSRYLDDLIISGGQPISRRVRRQIREVIAKADLQISPKRHKTGLYDLTRKPVVMGGVELLWRRSDQRVQFHIPQRELERLHRLLDEAIAHPTRYKQGEVAGQMSLAIQIMRARHQFPLGHVRRWTRTKAQTEAQLRLHRKYQRYLKRQRQRRQKGLLTP